MELIDIKGIIESKFKKKLPSHIFLDKMRLPDEDLRKGFAYNDHTYIPFYYWLGEIIQPKHLLEIGFRLGLLSGTFLSSCKTVECFFAFQEVKKEFYSERLGRSNIKDVYKKKLFIYKGGIKDEVFLTKMQSMEFDLVIINEEDSYDRHRLYYDLVWPQLNVDGIIVVNYLKKCKTSDLAFKDFVISKNLEPTYIDTNYGIGLIRKA